MNTTIKNLFAVGFASILLVGCETHIGGMGGSCCSASGDKKCPMKTDEYEYKTVKIQVGSDADLKLNEAAKGGWELVTATTPFTENGNGSGGVGWIFYTFERLKQ